MYTNDKQQFILDVAEAVFFSNGFRNTTIRKITVAAQINTAMLHYYFRSKEHLFEQVLLRKITLIESAVAQKINAQNPADTLQEAIRLQVDLVFEHKAFYRLLYAELLIGENEAARQIILSFFHSARQRLGQTLRKAIAESVLDIPDPDLALVSFFGTLLHGITVIDQADALQSRLSDFFRFSLRFYFRLN